MICPQSEEELKNVTKTVQNNPPKRRKNKNKKKKNKSKQNNSSNGIKKDTNRRRNSRNSSMSLGENLSAAASWQLKHKLAYWKAKAKSLEYENGVLHNIIKKNYGQSSSNSVVTSQSDTEIDESEELSEDDVACGDEDFEVSEEFVEFLRANAKYKEDARRERESLKAKQKAEEDSRVKEMEAGPSMPVDQTEELKKLYGKDWQRISALEMYLQSQYIEESDRSQPIYWPNIPFNFNFS